MEGRIERIGEAFIREVKQTQVPYGCAAVWFLGQESVIIKGADMTVYVDPFVSDWLEVHAGASRTYPAPIGPEQITNADVCLITHEHEDHLDKGTIPHLVRNNPACMVMAPACCRDELLALGVDPARYAKADPLGGWVTIGSALRIMPVAAAHERLEQDEQGNHRYVGYLMELNGVKIYHAGDTVVYPELVELIRSERVDLAMLPINGRDYFRTSRGIVGNMDYREAAEFAAATEVDTVIPLHYDIFAGNAENPGYFTDYLYRHFPWQKSHVMARHERFVYVSAHALGRE